MAEFTDYLQRLRTSQPFMEIGMNMGILKQVPEPNSSILEGFCVFDFSADSLLAYQQPEFPAGHANNSLLTASHSDILSAEPIVHRVMSNQNVLPEFKKRKAAEQSTGSSKNISATLSTINTKNKIRLERGSKGKNGVKEMGKAEEVIHVRAKRGQATDSHSIAERVRREKINNKLRCLQDLVPGCNKSMGMAVMLEEIVNYVHSLQNQVEFLSMELASASCSYDPNLETESSKKQAQGAATAESQELQKWLRERQGEISPSKLHGPFDCFFGR